MTIEDTSNQKPADSTDIIISVSEIHEYFYCPYAWWFQDFSQERLKKLQEGESYHTEFAIQQVSEANYRSKWLLLAIAIILACAAIALRIVGVW